MNNESEHKRRKRERSTSTHNEDDGGNESDLEGASDDSGNNNTSSNRKIAGSKLGTSSPSGSNSASTPAISANKPRSKPGRKRTDVPADDKRTAQNRIAQRAFRDRKLQYVKDLETRVQQLSAIVEGNPEFVALKETTDLRNRISELEHQLLLGSNSASESQCENCTQLQQQNDQLAARNAIYENNLAQQQHEYNILKQIVMGSNNLNNDMNYSNNNQNNNSNNDDNNNDLYAQILNNNQPNNVVLAPLLASTPSAISSESPFLQASTAQLALLSSGMLEEMSFSPSSSNILSDESYDPAHDNAFTSASELFGTMYVDAHRTALKQVSSISKCPHVDEMMDTLLKLSDCSNFRKLKKLMLRFIALKTKLMDVSSLLEKQRVIEIVENFRTEHRQHMNHFYERLRESTSSILSRRPLTGVQEKVLQQMEQFKKSCKSIPSFANSGELIDEMCFEFSSQALCKDEAEREEKFLCVMAIQGQLQALCTTEGDRTKLLKLKEID